MRATIFLTCLAFSVSAFAGKERKLYVGSDSTEAIMTFAGTVEMEKRSKPSLTEAKSHIDEQVNHLFGPMGEAEYQAVPKGDQKISNIRISAVRGQTYKISYDYRGTIVLKKGAGPTYEIVLPVNPSSVYSAGLVGDHNPCTDEHYQAEGDFWYFWNPAKEGCRLQEGRDYLKIKAKVQRQANTRRTFPEYDRLVDENGVISMTLLMGMDDPRKQRDPNTSNDINAQNFRDIKNSFLQGGWQSRLWSENEIREVVQKRINTKDLSYVEEFTKTSRREGRDITLAVRVVFGPSGIDEKSTSFHYFFKDALENSSVLMYDGHSGLGGHLDLDSIEQANGFKLRPNKNRYQIYYFNSCSSYTYYNTMYFGRKSTAGDREGTKNLDIMTNGLATYFSVMHDTNFALISAIEAYASGKALVSYQTLARQIDSGNLFGINGDEDNSKH